MELKLTKKPKNPIIIQGFPGFGFVGSIATQFLIEHLNAEKIGSIESTEMVPIVAIHKGKVLDPLSVYYDKKHNIVILQALTNIGGFEWKVSEIVSQMYKTLNAKELICIEGVSADEDPKIDTYYQASNIKIKNKFDKLGLKPLNEGIVLGVTGALLLKNIPCSCIFVEANMNLPDSGAAAKIIEILDSYLGLKVDYKPLVKKAEAFEAKLKDLMVKTKQATSLKQNKDLDYLG